MKKVFFSLFLICFCHQALAYKVRYGEKNEIKTFKLRLATIKEIKIELYGDNDSIAARKLKGLEKQQLTKLTHPQKTLGHQICQKLFGSDIALGINEFNNSVSFCLFQDKSFIPLDSLSNWARQISK